MVKWTNPLKNAVIEITNKCNLKCSHCGSDSGKARSDELSTDRIIEIVNELSDLGCEEITLLGGEVFLRKGWQNIVTAVTKKAMRLILITNGLLIDDDIYDFLKESNIYLTGVSIDGPSENKYKKLRGVNGFEKVMTLLRKLEADTSFPHVNAITTFTRDNLHDFDDFVSLFENTGITWQVQIANKGGARFDNNLFITKEDYKWFVDRSTNALINHRGLKLRFMDDFGYFPRSPELAFLHQTWEGCIAGTELVGIRSDGLVCGCLSMGEQFMEADLKKESLTAIWQSNKYFQSFRKRLENLSGRCKNCEMAQKCKGGCAAMAVSTSSNMGCNLYCIRQIEEDEIKSLLWSDH